MSLLQLSRALGHSKPSTTLDIYSHVFEDGGAPALALGTVLPAAPVGETVEALAAAAAI